jgi:hypothetical protein
MRTILRPCLLGMAYLLLAGTFGCIEGDKAGHDGASARDTGGKAKSGETKKEDDLPPGDPATGRQVASLDEEGPNPNVFLEVVGDRRRVLVNSQVCLREGMLEQLLTKKRMKEHEAILAADVDARNIHLALVAARAEPGSPVRFQPKFQPPTGTTIKITLEYPLHLAPDPKEKGKFVRITSDKETTRIRAQRWIRGSKTKKDLDTDWVFAGSILSPDPLDKTKPPFYRANEGDVICVSNFDTAMLDVPFNSSKDNDDLAFEACTSRIPEEKTPVVVILEPVLAKKK